MERGRGDQTNNCVSLQLKPPQFLPHPPPSLWMVSGVPRLPCFLWYLRATVYCVLTTPGAGYPFIFFLICIPYFFPRSFFLSIFVSFFLDLFSLFFCFDSHFLFSCFVTNSSFKEDRSCAKFSVWVFVTVNELFIILQRHLMKRKSE